MADFEDNDLLAITADVVAAHVSNNNVNLAELPQLIQSVHAALRGLGKPVEKAEPEQQPAVSIRASVKPDYIVCLEDGAKLKMLKRYLATRYDMTPAQYRAKWKLPADYPMVAPNYTEQRRTLAKEIGLGRKRAAPEAAPEPAAEPEAAEPQAPRGRGRPRRQPSEPEAAPPKPGRRRGSSEAAAG